MNFLKFLGFPNTQSYHWKSKRKLPLTGGCFITIFTQNIVKYSLLFSYNDSWRHYTTSFYNIFFSIDVEVPHRLFSYAMSNKVREEFQKKR